MTDSLFDGGIRSINFFNGRVLSGDDLSQEQAANCEVHRLLGKAVGEGIVYGLEVSEVSKGPEGGGQPLVSITPGVAINREGRVVQLPVTVTLSLASSANGGTQGRSTFAACQPFQQGVYVSGNGVYLLTIAPAEGRQGRALISGLGNTGADCSAKYRVEGVQFRLTQLDFTNEELSDEDHLRNLVAYECFGVNDLKSFVADPFGPPLTSYGLLDQMRPKRLGDCEVPLAVVHWTATDGIKFVDTWSVRRQVFSAAASSAWAPLVSTRRVAEGLAMLLQFQKQINEMVEFGVGGKSLNSITATDYFAHLPAAGFIPIGGIKSSIGFDYLQFFKGHTYRNPVFIEGAKLATVLRSSLLLPPINLGNAEMLWLYRLRENMEAVAGGIVNLPQPCLLLTNGHIPYQGNAQYDLNYSDYANYA